MRTTMATPAVSPVLVRRALIVALMITASSAQAVRVPRDTIWTHPDAAARTVREVAILPVVNVLNEGTSSAFVERRLVPHFCDRTHVSWIDPDGSRRLLQRRTRHPYTQLDSLARQVWRNVAVDSLTAADLAKQLQVQNVLCIRVDRWDRIETWDARRARAWVGMRCALVDSAGSVLWTASGENWARTSLPFQKELAESEDRGTPPSSSLQPDDWGVPIPTAEQRRAPDFDQAVAELLERWAKRFPLRGPLRAD